MSEDDLVVAPARDVLEKLRLDAAHLLGGMGRIVAIPTGTSERSRDEMACPGVGRGLAEQSPW